MSTATIAPPARASVIRAQMHESIDERTDDEIMKVVKAVKGESDDEPVQLDRGMSVKEMLKYDLDTRVGDGSITIFNRVMWSISGRVNLADELERIITIVDTITEISRPFAGGEGGGKFEERMSECEATTIDYLSLTVRKELSALRKDTIEAHDDLQEFEKKLKSERNSKVIASSLDCEQKDPAESPESENSGASTADDESVSDESSQDNDKPFAISTRALTSDEADEHKRILKEYEGTGDEADKGYYEKMNRMWCIVIDARKLVRSSLNNLDTITNQGKPIDHDDVFAAAESLRCGLVRLDVAVELL